MDITAMFGSAIWVGARPDSEGNIPLYQILRSRFSLPSVKKATLRIVGMGFFHCYLNGKRVSEDYFIPLSTDYEPRENYPIGETLSGHRLYVPEFDVTDMLASGDNTLAVHFGGGWYAVTDEAGFGKPKVIWRLFGQTESGEEFDLVSSEADLARDSFVRDGFFPCWENRDYTLGITEDAFEAGFDDSGWDNAVAARPVETEYLISDCPPDRICETLEPRLLAREEGFALYDAGKNCTGWPLLKLTAAPGETVTLYMGEELNSDGSFSEFFNFHQTVRIVSDGRERLVHPDFAWFGFRYFKIVGSAEPVCVQFVHTDAARTADFTSDNEILNWIHDAYVNTQLCNMHAGIPSDCPHLERRGYTGDGQLTCHAAMDILDAKAFYKKWIHDIMDCQDISTGHIQYTAPYLRSGGGPGGWGCAIVEVPYQYYLHYGDDEMIRLAYPAMVKYFEYLEAHSSGDLVISDKKGEWCLGDWCPPIQVILPAPFVNNYFYIKSLQRTVEIARIIGREEDIPLFESRIAARKKATVEAYYNSWDGNFLGNMQGANAFAVDIGLGDKRTYENLVARYSALDGFDTGIFGTDIVTRVLFEHGDGDVAYKLLTSTARSSFGEMKRLGATTIWEYWPGSLTDRSHNHPMFGAVAAYLYDHILGIRSLVPGQSEILISPACPKGLGKVSGYRTLCGGKLSVEIESDGKSAKAKITVPQGVRAGFAYGETKADLATGENFISFEL